MEVTQEMYLALFDGIRAAQEKLDEAMAALKAAQEKAEKLYIEQPE